MSPVSELVRSLLAKRGVVEEKEVEDFLNPDYEAHTHDPFLMRDMERAVVRVFAAIQAGERIAVYADFDCDGVPGAALLSDVFSKIGYANVEIYIPHRDREGYGFHKEAIEELAARGVSLIITVDVGTTAVEAVAFAKEKGVDVIVTDHHEIVSTLPDAYAVLNPKLPEYPFPHLCGTGVAYKFAQAILAEGRKRNDARFAAIPEGWEKWLLDLVAIATVADMVPLIGENRVLAHFGLRVLRKSKRAGIRALCTRLRLRQHELTEDDIGFSIAPRVNAASRMDEPMLAFRLLTTTSAEEADALASTLESLNTKRKSVVASIVREAKKHASVRYTPHDRVVVLGNTAWKPALLGLAANSLLQDRSGVVCLWGRDALGRLKGSCRSDESASVVALFTSVSAHLEEFGGHERSGGFSVSHESVHTLPDVFASAASLSEASGPTSLAEADALVALPEVGMPLFSEVARLAPFGAGNPKPIFRVPRVSVLSTKRFGKEKNHVEVSLVDGSARMRAYDFFRSENDFTHVPCAGERVAVHVSIERDSFRGGLALRLVDILSA